MSRLCDTKIRNAAREICAVHDLCVHKFERFTRLVGRKEEPKLVDLAAQSFSFVKQLLVDRFFEFLEDLADGIELVICREPPMYAVALDA